MAWKAAIKAVKTPTERPELVVDVWYYDDADPATVLANHSFTFSNVVPIAQIRAEIIARGQAMRTLVTDRLTKAQGFVGATLNIP